MVEPLFFSALGSDTQIGSKFVLSGSEARHAISVRRIQIGEKVKISDGFERLVRGQVSKIDRDLLEIVIQDIQKLVEPKTKIYLCQALAKGDRDELAIQAATELGVHGIIPWQADRSISIWKDEKKVRGVARWQAIVQEASKQSLRGLFPKVETCLSSPELVARLKEFSLVLVLDPLGDNSITDLDLGPVESLAVIVGPEGGMSESELESFNQAGFRSIHLGEGVLRTSTAGMAAISYLQAKLGAWN